MYWYLYTPQSTLHNINYFVEISWNNKYCLSYSTIKLITPLPTSSLHVCQPQSKLKPEIVLINGGPSGAVHYKNREDHLSIHFCVPM